MKDTSRHLKDCGHELANGGDMRVAMGNHSPSEKSPSELAEAQTEKKRR